MPTRHDHPGTPNRRPEPPEPAGTGTSARAAEWDGIRAVLHAVLPGITDAEMTGDRNLKDLGADSVDRVEIIVALKDRFGVDEPLDAFSGIPHLTALADLLHAARTR